VRREADSRKWMAAQALPFSLRALRMGLRALWERAVNIGRRPEKRLRLCESLPLGERRFVAVVEFEKTRFLVGGTATSLVLLSRLGEEGLGQEDLRGEDLRGKDPGKNRGERC
jgi:flagellar biogenesis protein FliO